MAKVVGDIAVTVGADTSAFERAMKRAGKSTDEFGSKAAKLGDFLGRGLVGVGLGAGTMIAFGQATLDAAREIQNLSRIAGTSTTEFQKYAFAAESVGIQQDKLADILKDVNDKFGDFMANGAGPLKDFFDNIAPKVGVTAEQFARLSGPDALQLYVRSLEQAGVSQQQMTFYMEALASDATALVPLLRDGGKALQDLGTIAEESGVVISEALITSGNEMAEKFRQIMESMVGYAKQGFLQILHMANTTFGITESGVIEKLRTQRDALADEVNQRRTELQNIEQAVATSLMPNAPLPPEHTALSEVLGVTEEELNVVNDQLTKLKSAADERAAALNSLIDGKTAIDSKRRGGGGSKDKSETGLERLRDSLATESEALETWRAEQLEKLREYRDAKMITEQEYNELEARIKQEHAERLAQIEASAMSQRMGMFRGALGDLASLMQTENDKLFKVGKAAALAQAIVDGHQSAVAAWKHGMNIGGPPVAAAFTAASLARTGAMISQIASASPRGTSAGGGAGGGAAAAAPAAAPLQVMLSGIGQNDFIRGSQLGELLDRLQDEAGDRGYRLMVAQ